MLLCTALTLGSLRAGERVPVQRPPEGDSISAAGRELDAVKSSAANAANVSGTSMLPRLAVPPPQASADAAAPVLPLTGPKDAAKQDRSANWLVDAMLKPSERKPGERPRDPRDRRSAGTLDPHASGQPGLLAEAPDGTADAASESRDTGRTEAAERTPTAGASDQAFNPLARYMAGWLAPQDYALLRRTLETPSSASSRSVDAPGAAPAGVDLTNTAIATDLLSGLAGSDPRAAGAAAKPVENPYLEALTLPTAPPPVPTPPPAAVPETSPLPQVSAPSEPAPRPVIPPFVKPASDDKYYKPLKRF